MSTKRVQVDVASCTGPSTPASRTRTDKVKLGVFSKSNAKVDVKLNEYDPWLEVGV